MAKLTRRQFVQITAASAAGAALSLRCDRGRGGADGDSDARADAADVADPGPAAPPGVGAGPPAPSDGNVCRYRDARGRVVRWTNGAGSTAVALAFADASGAPTGVSVATPYGTGGHHSRDAFLCGAEGDVVRRVLGESVLWEVRAALARWS